MLVPNVAKIVPVMPVIFRVVRRHYFQPDMKSQVFSVNELGVLRESKKVMRQGNANKRYANADRP